MSFNPCVSISVVVPPSSGHCDFMYLEESAKNHAKVHVGVSGFMDAMLRYGNPKKQLQGWTYLDYASVMDHLDEELMTKFDNRYPLQVSWLELTCIGLPLLLKGLSNVSCSQN